MIAKGDCFFVFIFFSGIVVLEFIFGVIFTIEMLIKMIALGLWSSCHPFYDEFLQQSRETTPASNTNSRQNSPSPSPWPSQTFVTENTSFGDLVDPSINGTEIKPNRLFRY